MIDSVIGILGGDGRFVHYKQFMNSSSLELRNLMFTPSEIIGCCLLSWTFMKLDWILLDFIGVDFSVLSLYYLRRSSTIYDAFLLSSIECSESLAKEGEEGFLDISIRPLEFGIID